MSDDTMPETAAHAENAENAENASPPRKRRTKAERIAEDIARAEARAKRDAAKRAAAPWKAAQACIGEEGRYGLDTVACSMRRDAPCWLVATDGKLLGRFVVDDYEAVKPNEPERYIDGAQYRDGARVTDARPFPPVAELFAGGNHAGWAAPAVFRVDVLARALEAARLAGAGAVRFAVPCRDADSGPARLDLFAAGGDARVGPVNDNGAIGTIIVMPMVPANPQR